MPLVGQDGISAGDEESYGGGIGWLLCSEL